MNAKLIIHLTLAFIMGATWSHLGYDITTKEYWFMALILGGIMVTA